MRGKGVVDKIIRGDVEQTKSLRQSKYASGGLGKMDPRDWEGVAGCQATMCGVQLPRSHGEGRT